MKIMIPVMTVLLLVTAMSLLPVTRAQEEPSMAPEPDMDEPMMDAEQPPAEARPFRLAVLEGEPLRRILDFDRWLEMSYRERQTFAEGAVLTLTSISRQLRGELGANGKVPPENLKALVKFVQDHYPKLPPSEYMTEMDRIYLTAEGQNLSVMECFNLAFRRLNAR